MKGIGFLDGWKGSNMVDGKIHWGIIIIAVAFGILLGMYHF